MTEDRWHLPLVHVLGRELRADTGQTPGMTRREAKLGISSRSQLELVLSGDPETVPPG